MPCVNKYPKDHIDACRSKMESQLAADKRLKPGAAKSAIDAFELLFCNNLVVVLDS